MLPIPDRIIGSKQLFIPLAYIGLTVTLCYYFLLGFVHTQKFSFVERVDGLTEPNTYSKQQQEQDNPYPYPYSSPASADLKEIYDENDDDVYNSRRRQLHDLDLETQNLNNPSIIQGVGDGIEIERKGNLELESEGKEAEGQQKNLLPLLLFSNKNSHSSQFQSAQLEGERRASTSLNNNSSKSNSQFLKSENGSGRSKPSKIRNRHQDNPDWIDLTASQFIPWLEDPDCNHFTVRFAKRKTFQPRALVSYPGSGNSWIRYAIEGITGVFTGSIFGDRKLYNSGLLGEMRQPTDGSTIVQKTHFDALAGSGKEWWARERTRRMFDYRGILVIRNPYDALRSFWNYRYTKDHKAVAATSKVDIEKWETFVSRGASKWSGLIEAWMESSDDSLIVVYEELKANPRSELIRILNYLHFPVDEGRLDCLLKHLEGPFHRTKHSSEKLSFTANNSHLDLIVQEQIDYINRYLALKDAPLRLNYTLTN